MAAKKKQEDLTVEQLETKISTVKNLIRVLSAIYAFLAIVVVILFLTGVLERDNLLPMVAVLASSVASMAAINASKGALEKQLEEKRAA